MTRFNMPEDVPLTHSLVSKSIENAQVKVEGFHFDTRKHLVQYDDVLDKQREIIYRLRRKVLEASVEAKEEVGLRQEVQERIISSIQSLVTTQVAANEGMQDPNEKIVAEFVTIIPFDDNSQKQLITQLEQRHTAEDKTEFLIKLAQDLYAKREEQLGE